MKTTHEERKHTSNSFVAVRPCIALGSLSPWVAPLAF